MSALQTSFKVIETLKDSRTSGWPVVLTTPIAPAPEAPKTNGGEKGEKGELPEWKQQHDEKRRQQEAVENDARKKHEDAVPEWKRQLGSRLGTPGKDNSGPQKEAAPSSGRSSPERKLSFFDLKCVLK